MTKSLRKYDHITHHLSSLLWLPVNKQIRYRSLCAMHQHYVGDAIPFDLPISFGTFHGHNTRCPSSFTNLPRHRLSNTQHFFISELQNGGINFHLTLLARLSCNHFLSALYSYLLTK